jgi:hypothetical protein
MIESPLIQELRAEWACARTHQDILAVLETRFGEVPRDLPEKIASVVDDDQLTELVRKAASCPDLKAFRNEVERS